MMAGYWVTRAVHAAVKLRLPDLVDSGVRTVQELAERTGTRPERLRRLLRALASSGIFALVPGERVAPTPLSSALSEQTPGSVRWAALMYEGPQYDIWSDLLPALSQDGSPFKQRYGTSFFEWLGSQPEKRETFHKAMRSIHGAEAGAILSVHLFSAYKHVVDVGGGNGSLLSTILARYPKLQTTLFDLPHAIEEAKAGAGGPLPNAQLVAGDFFQSVPEGGDAYLLRHVLHDWSDEDCLRILRNCASAMKPGAKLLVLEALVEWDASPTPAKWIDLHMMMETGGAERSTAEYRALLESAGLSFLSATPTPHPGCAVIVASNR
jgi:hypothetical protein